MPLGKPFNKNFPLGKMMAEEKVGVNELAAKTGVSHRKLSDYLANRVPFINNHLIKIADFFDCDPEDLVPDIPPFKQNHKQGAYG